MYNDDIKKEKMAKEENLESLLIWCHLILK